MIYKNCSHNVNIAILIWGLIWLPIAFFHLILENSEPIATLIIAVFCVVSLFIILIAYGEITFEN